MHLLMSSKSHTCLRGNIFNGCPNQDIPLCPSSFVIYSCYCHVLVTLLSSVFCLSQWLDERSQKERSVLTGGDRSNSQLPIVFLKQESSWRKIWIRFWLAGQTCEHIDISLKYMQVIQAIWIRDMDAKLALSFALFKHVSLIFSKIKKNTCLEIIELKSLVTCFKVRSAVVLYF